MKWVQTGFVVLVLAWSVGCGESSSRKGTSETNSSDGQQSRTGLVQDAYLTRRAHFKTELISRTPSPQVWDSHTPPAGVEVVEYVSQNRGLMAWLSIPEHAEGESLPALVYMHGGFAFGPSDYEVCRPFVEAGFVVMCPTFRGENGNPGDFEMMFGEVDDAARAVLWLADQPYVDPDRVYTFGHSSGGVVSAVLSLYDNVPIRLSGSAGALYGPDLFDAIEQIVPFNMASDEEKQIRLLVGNIAWMNLPHIAYVGTQDTYMRVDEARLEATGEHEMLEVVLLQGDHHSTLSVAIDRFLQRVQSEAE